MHITWKDINSVYGSIHEQIPVVKMFEENLNKRENWKLKNFEPPCDPCDPLSFIVDTSWAEQSRPQDFLWVFSSYFPPSKIVLILSFLNIWLGPLTQYFKFG
jgi:hypothetical protein